MNYHCIVRVNETTIISIGGRGSLSAQSFTQTMYFNHDHLESQKWTFGPEMKVGRAHHSCGKFTIGDISVIVVAGGISNANGPGLTSVEFLLENGTTWIEGPDLPTTHSYSTDIVSNGDNLYLIDTFLRIILRLACNSGIQSCQWIEQEHNLQIKRADAIVSLIPDHMTNCSDES